MSPETERGSLSERKGKVIPCTWRVFTRQYEGTVKMSQETYRTDVARVHADTIDHWAVKVGRGRSALRLEDCMHLR